jgi:hypothetical protein
MQHGGRGPGAVATDAATLELRSVWSIRELQMAVFILISSRAQIGQGHTTVVCGMSTGQGHAPDVRGVSKEQRLVCNMHNEHVVHLGLAIDLGVALRPSELVAGHTTSCGMPPYQRCSSVSNATDDTGRYLTSMTLY